MKALSELQMKACGVMKNVTMLRRKVARFRKKGYEVLDESLRSSG
jgi:hypothetical protein